MLCTLATTAAPFALGAARGGAARSPPPAEQLAALLLLYAECCERLCDAEAILYLSDVLVALALGKARPGPASGWAQATSDARVLHRGVLRGVVGGVVRAVRAGRAAVAGGRARRGSVRAAALAGHA